MATIGIEGIAVHGYHGVYAEEKQSGNNFEIDLWLETDIRKAAETDDLARTVDYGAVYNLVLSIMAQPVDLLETLVQSISFQVLEAFPLVSQVRIRIRKLKPMGMPQCASTYVEEIFSR
ncbi:MAG: dihydroneopterin aldolase [Bacteroidota bacterium]